jgi:acyl transferase domain-containing protein
VPLPTYPFQHRHYWLTTTRTGGDPGTGTAAQAPGTAPGTASEPNLRDDLAGLSERDALGELTSHVRAQVAAVLQMDDE